MKAHGAREFVLHLQSDSHWIKDVVYCVYMGMPVLNGFMENMKLSEEQLAEYRAKLFVELGEGYPFREKLLPKHSRLDSKVPFMTFQGCLCDQLRCGRDFARVTYVCGRVRRLWSHFCLLLGKQKPDFSEAI